MVKHSESSAITGQDLLNLLALMTPEMLAQPVHFAYPAGDYWRTVASGAVANVAEGSIAYNRRLEMFEVLDEDQIQKIQDRRQEALAEGEDVDMDEPLEYDNQPVLDALIITI